MEGERELGRGKDFRTDYKTGEEGGRKRYPANLVWCHLRRTPNHPPHSIAFFDTLDHSGASLSILLGRQHTHQLVNINGDIVWCVVTQRQEDMANPGIFRGVTDDRYGVAKNTYRYVSEHLPLPISLELGLPSNNG